MKSLIIIIFASCLITSCSTTSKSANSNAQNSERHSDTDFINKNLDLTAQLRSLPGVIVNGEGSSANFQVRGATSISAPTEPLFVLNGRAYQNYSAVYRMVYSQDFESARVLKDASETAYYGSRGANGVIVIKTK